MTILIEMFLGTMEMNFFSFSNLQNPLLGRKQNEVRERELGGEPSDFLQCVTTDEILLS